MGETIAEEACREQLSEAGRQEILARQLRDSVRQRSWTAHEREQDDASKEGEDHE